MPQIAVNRFSADAVRTGKLFPRFFQIGCANAGQGVAGWEYRLDSDSELYLEPVADRPQDALP